MNNRRDIPATRVLIEQGIAAGLHIGAQVYVSINGAPVADLAFGQSRPGVPMTPDTLMLWLSGGKPIGAVAIAQLWERGKLGLDDPVARHIPEFGQNGKEPITIRHILTHTAGFRWVATGWPTASWEQVIARICQARQEPSWVAGKKAGYSPYTSWFILGEIVRRLDGRDYHRYVRDEIFLPLGMRDSWMALPADRYRAYGDRIGIMQKTDEEGGPSDAGLDTEESAGASRPGGSGRGPARELGWFYEMLLGFAPGATDRTRSPSPGTPGEGWGEGLVSTTETSFKTGMPLTPALSRSTGRGRKTPTAGKINSPIHDQCPPDSPDGASRLPHILLPQTIEALIARHRTGMKDTTFNHVMDWGLGFQVNSSLYGSDAVPYGLGPHASPRAFGHGGSQSSASFADPEHGLAVVVICNGRPGEPAHQKRIRAILAAIYEDLGFGGMTNEE
jgi:CubicO group peptidase (beta-lactamase class C family)